MKLIVLAAGQGTRLRPLTDEIPKCMVPLEGKPLLQHQLETARAAGITDLHVATGYREEAIRFTGITRHYNPDYDSTNMVESLFCAESIMDDDLIVGYGDIVYQVDVLRALMDDPGPVSVVVDRKWERYWRARNEDPLEDAETLLLNEDKTIRELGKKPRSLAEIQGQYIGLMKFTREALEKIRPFYHALDRHERYDGKEFRQMYMTSFLQLIADRLMPIRAVFIENGWMEVDCPSDLEATDFLYRRGAARDTAQSAPERTIILVHGFKYSGSSAVIDWLRDLTEVCVMPVQLPAGHAVEILHAGTDAEKGEAAARWLAQMEKDGGKPEAPDRAARTRELLKRILRAFGAPVRVGVHRPSDDPEGEAERETNRRYLAPYAADAGAGPNGRLTPTGKPTPTGRLTPEEEIAHWRGWLEERISARCGNAPFVVADATLPDPGSPTYPTWIALLQRVQSIAVHRDPQDQMREIIRQMGWKKIRAKSARGRTVFSWATSDDPGGKFLEQLRQDLAALRDRITEDGTRYTAVPFEGIVRETALWSTALARRLGVAETYVAPEQRRFDPAVSGRNIGIGRDDTQIQEFVANHRKLLDEIDTLRRDLDRLSLEERA